MRDVMAPLAVEEWLAWLRAEERLGTLLGIDRRLVFEPSPADPFRRTRFGRLLETPFGVAAGPHTQLAGNIAAAWLVGARFIELKTVQVLDRLEVPKPCIAMPDEGYNCEWSQELTLEQSFQEYLTGWLLVRVLQERLGFEPSGEPGFLFNLSVGYDLAGVTSSSVQRFLDRAEDPRDDARALWARARAVEPLVDRVPIPSRLSDNVTLSTMHGCPPEEIERIALHLIRDRGLHTAVKLNPTLLGPETVREILNGRLGYPVQVPDEAFAHDIAWDEALDVLRSLEAAAARAGVAFSVKLTNTLEVIDPGTGLPERTLYLSGRALHPLAVALAARLQEAFGGRLDLSFAGGADYRNAPDLVAAGLDPVTVCSDLLRPGGYGRLRQYMETLRERMEAVGAAGLAAFVRRTAGAGETVPVTEAALRNLLSLAARLPDDPRYHHGRRTAGSIKGDRPLPPLDCVHAPCIESCATGQEVPAYIGRIAEGDPAGALAVILETNPLPATTGQVCDHLCQSRCTRIDMDDPLLIRELKRFAEEFGRGAPAPEPGPPCGRSAAVIGAGPSGLSCAWFLRLAGWDVAVYDAAERAGGLVSATIPAFRLLPDALARDIARIEALGVRFRFGERLDAEGIERLRNTHDAVYLAIGAGTPRRPGIPGDELPGVLTALELLAAVRRQAPPSIGPSVAVIGGGNAAMDAARTARRLSRGEVTVLYRRSAAAMPADRDEVREALAEGVRLVEHVQPVAIVPSDGRLTLRLRRTRPGEPDAGGRRRPVEIPGSEHELTVDTVVAAVGQEPVLDRLGLADLEADPATGRTSRPRLYLGGDALRGPATVITAVGDGRRAAAAILQDAGTAAPPRSPSATPRTDRRAHRLASARRIEGTALPEVPPNERHGFAPVVRTLTPEEARREAARCLHCDEVCDVCVTVCPNRAMLAVEAEPTTLELRPVTLSGRCVTLGEAVPWRLLQRPQVIVLTDLCNECGNCATFCPTSGAPYRDKPRLWLSRPDWEADPGPSYLVEATDTGLSLALKQNGRIERFLLPGHGPALWTTPEARLELDRRTLAILRIEPLADARRTLDPARAALAWAILRMLEGHPLAAAAAARTGRTRS